MWLPFYCGLLFFVRNSSGKIIWTSVVQRLRSEWLCPADVRRNTAQSPRKQNDIVLCQRRSGNTRFRAALGVSRCLWRLQIRLILLHCRYYHGVKRVLAAAQTSVVITIEVYNRSCDKTWAGFPAERWLPSDNAKDNGRWFASILPRDLWCNCGLR